MLPSRSWQCAAAALAQTVTALCAAEAPLPPPSPVPQDFVRLLTGQFAAWDRNHDGALSADEAEQAVADPANCNEIAAVAVAVRRKLRGDPTRGPISLAQLAAPAADGGPAPLCKSLETLYRHGAAKLQNTPRTFVVGEPPALDNLGQGHLGDCFLLVGIGMLVHTDPERLVHMLEVRPDGRMAVHLGCGRTLDLSPPTDGEIVIGARTRDTGTWGVALEKAIGTLYLERQKTPRHVTPLSIIGVGGSPHRPVELFTGHVVRKFGCQALREPGLSESERQQKLAEIRTQLTAAFAAKRLVVGGNGPIGHQAIVPGIYHNHSYGVLSYDPVADVVTFWNPFGNTFTPKGPPGLEHGYVTSHGRFQVPLTEAVKWFGAFSIEQDAPLPKMDQFPGSDLGDMPSS